MYFPCPHLCSDHVSMVQMIMLRSTVDRSFWTPLIVLSLTEGGGGGSGITDKTRMHLDDSGSRDQIYDQYWIPDPPSILPLMEGGGGPECVINRVHRSTTQKQAHRSTTQDVFWTPSTNLPLNEGGGSEWFSSSGKSLFIRGNDLMALSPIISYYLIDLRHLWTSPSTFLEIVTSHNCC
jgi:hypothetical protein